MEPPQAGTLLVGLAAVIALIGANAFFVAAEFALVGARKTRLDEMARDGDRKAMLAGRVHQSLSRYISATQLGITLCSLGLGWIGEPALSALILKAFQAFPDRIGPVRTEAIATVISFGAITYTLIILGELLPKALALRYPEVIASWMAGPLIAFAWVMAFPIRILNNTANWILKLMGIKVGPHERLHSPEEIRMLVEQSQEGGQLGKQDARLLEGVFEFTEKTAQDVMTPRTEIVALEAGLTVEQAADIVAAAGRSRYPVHLDSLDDIIGIVHAKDLLRVLRSTPEAPVRSVIRPPHLVPNTREVEDVLADMKRLKVHMAIVIDEYGGTAGLVTMEDLLEEIVGPIFDEHDAVERQPLADGTAPLLDGAMTISEFNAAHDAALDDTDYTTLGGYLFGQLGRLPQPGDRVTAGDFVFEIIAMEGRRVKKISALGTRRSALGEASGGGPGGRPK